MADEINFSGKLAKKIELDKVKPDGVQNDRKDKVASLFNKQKDNNDASILTADELVVLNQIDKNHDGKITDDEIKTYYNANYKDNQTNNPNQVTEAEYISYVKAMAKANQEALETDAANVGNAYTVQLGEGLDDLATRVAKSIKSNPSAEDIADIKQQIINLNKTNGAIKFDGNGNVKWLVGGQQLILPTDTTSVRAKKNVKNQDNKAQVESKYKAWRDGRGPLKSFTYKIDDDGKTYEVRSSGETEFDASKMYSVDSGDYEVTSVKEEDIVNYDAIEFEEGKADETKEKIKTAIDAINSLTDKENIDGTPTRDGNKVTIKLKDGGKVVVNYGDTNDRNKITDIYYYPKDATSPSVTFEHTNKLYATGIKDGVQKGGVKDWSALTEIVEDAIAENYDAGADIVDLKDADYGNYSNNKDAVNARIKQGTDVLNKLKDADNIESIGDVCYLSQYNQYFVCIKTTDGENVTVFMNPDGSFIGAGVNLDGKDSSEIGFYNNKINLDLVNNKSGDWDINGLGKVDMDKLKALIPKDAMDKLKNVTTFSAEDKKKPIALRVAYYVSTPALGGRKSGWARVLTPDGQMHNFEYKVPNGGANEFNDVLHSLCRGLKDELKSSGWENVTLVNPNAPDGDEYLSKTASKINNIDKTKAYQIYVPWDQDNKVARVTLPDGQETVFTNVTTNPSQTEDIKKWIKDQGFVNARIRDNM